MLDRLGMRGERTAKTLFPSMVVSNSSEGVAEARPNRRLRYYRVVGFIRCFSVAL